MNTLDAAAIGLLLFGIVLGWRSGAVPQVVGLAGAAVGAAVGLWTVPWLVDLLEDVPPGLRAAGVLLGILGLVGLGEAIGSNAGRRVSAALGEGLLGALDRVMGGVVGAAQAVLVLWLVGGILATGVVPDLGRIAQGSRALRGIAVVLPPPTALVLELGKALDEAGLPDVFLGLERPPSEPVELPDDPVAQALGRAAAGSVFRVQADACRFRSTGTGFVVATGYLVTNAHVVAGASAIVVDSAAGSWSATLVFFDPDLDVAVLHANGLAASPLVWSAGAPARGDLGATFGYPGGEGAVVEPAAVTATFPAEGLDITGTKRVTRQIVELRAEVEPGDSGGPLLLTDGTVGGVVFAESRTDPNVGYALDPQQVAVAVTPSIGRTADVDPGPCIH